MRIQSLNTINYNQAIKQNDSQPVKEENNNLSFNKLNFLFFAKVFNDCIKCIVKYI